MNARIAIEGMECYAMHGCLDEEGMIGGKYTVDVYIEGNFNNSYASDDLADTIDYSMVHDTVREEMNTRSRLVEHVTARILGSIAKKAIGFSRLAVRVTKHNPPVNGQAGQSSFFLEATPGELPLTD